MAIMNDDMERAFLGSLLYGETKDLCWITEENFIVDSNKQIFKAVELLIWNESPVDILTVREKLQEMGKLEQVGGNSALVDISEGTYSSQNIAYYANKMKKSTKRSEVAKIAENILRSVADWEVDSWDIISYADRLLNLNNLDSSEYSLDSIIEDTMGVIEGNIGKELLGHSFGKRLWFLDRYTRWIRAGRTYRIGAMSNVWKTQLAYNMIVDLLDQGKKVAFFSLENDKTFTICNIMANKESVNSYAVEDGTHSVDFWWLDKHKKSFFLIDDEHDMSRIQARILEIKPDVVFLDYIGLVDIRGVKEEEVYTKYAKSMQKFVKKTGISLIDLSNLPINATEETVRQSWQFFGSSFLKNNTDVGLHIFYYTPFYEWRKSSWLQMDDKMKNIQVVTLLIQKNRIGTAKVEQVFVIDFNKGGMYREATEQELSVWNF